jgi:hypothetical protein
MDIFCLISISYYCSQNKQIGAGLTLRNSWTIANLLELQGLMK